MNIYKPKNFIIIVLSSRNVLLNSFLGKLYQFNYYHARSSNIYIFFNFLIRDGDSTSSNLLHKLTDDEHFADVVSSGNHLHITFTSDFSIARTGFYISWEFESKIFFLVISLWIKHNWRWLFYLRFVVHLWLIYIFSIILGSSPITIVAQYAPKLRFDSKFVSKFR